MVSQKGWGVGCGWFSPVAEGAMEVLWMVLPDVLFEGCLSLLRSGLACPVAKGAPYGWRAVGAVAGVISMKSEKRFCSAPTGCRACIASMSISMKAW